MPNYSLQVDNRRYDPTAFLNAAREDQKEQEADLRAAEISYGELSSKANMLEKLANDVKGKDSEAYKTYMNYANSLRQHTNILATNGLNPSTFKNIIQAKNDYSRMISPIEEAWTAREKESARQAEYLKQHPDAIFERDARDISIDQWMKNPHYTAKSIDKNALATRAAGAFSQFKKKLQDFVSQNGLDPNDTKSANLVKQWVKAGKVPWLYQALEKYGMNPDDVDKVMAGDPAYDNHILNKIINSELRSSGVLNWDTSLDHFDDEQNRQYLDNKIDEVRSAIVAQTPYAIGEDKFDKHTDSESAQVYRTKLEIAARAAENEAERKWKEKMAAAAAGNGPESINVDDAAASNPETIEGDLDHQEIINLANQIKSIDAGNGVFNDVSSTNLSDAIEDVAKELNVEPKELDYSNPEIIDKINKSAHDKKMEENHKWKVAGESFTGLGKSFGNLLVKFNPIGMLTQTIGAIKHSNTVAAKLSGESGLSYFLKSMVGMTGDDFLNAKKNFEAADDYAKLGNAKRSLKSAEELYSRDTPLDKKEWLRLTGNRYMGTKRDNNFEKFIDEQYNDYVTNYNNGKKSINDAKNNLDKLEKEMIGKGRIEMANTKVIKELKNYGYSNKMKEDGISPEFYADMLVTGNLMNWDRFESSVLNETSLKDIAQNFNNMITDRENPKYVKIYEFNPKTGAMDKVKTEDWMKISGADPQKKEAGQTPVFSTNAKHGLLTATYKDKNGKPVVYAVKENDLTRHPGFDKKIIETIKQEHEVYELLSNPEKLLSMPQKEKEVYTKSLFKGMDEETKAYHIRNACAAYLAETKPYIKTATQLNNELNNLSNTEIETIILRCGLHASLSGMNHDNLNRVVLDMLWGKDSSHTATPRKEVYESWMRNN